MNPVRDLPRVGTLRRALCLAAVVATLALLAGTPSAQSASGGTGSGTRSLADVPGQVRDPQQLSFLRARHANWIRTGHGDLASIFDGYGLIAAKSGGAQGELPASAFQQQAAAAAHADNDGPALARVAELLATDWSYRDSREPEDRPTFRIGCLWLSSVVSGRTSRALAIARAFADAHPKPRWPRKMVAASLILDGKYSDAIDVFASLLDEGAVAGEFGLTYRTSVSGAEVSDISAVHWSFIASGRVPIWQLSATEKYRIDDEAHTYEISMDLPELELWLHEAAADDATHQIVSSSLTGREGNGYRWIGLRLAAERALQLGNTLEASAAIAQLVEFLKANGAADDKPNPIISWLDLRRCIAEGQIEQGASRLAEVIKTADSGIFGRRYLATLASVVEGGRIAAAHLAAEFVARAPTDKLEAAITEASRVCSGTSLFAADVVRGAMMRIANERPQDLDAARKALAASISKRSLRLQRQMWVCGMGVTEPHPEDADEALSQLADIAASVVELVGVMHQRGAPTGVRTNTPHATRTRDELSLDPARWRVVSATPPVAPDPFGSMKRVAKIIVDSQQDGGLATIVSLVEERDGARKRLESLRSNNASVNEMFSAAFDYDMAQVQLTALLAVAAPTVATPEVIGESVEDLPRLEQLTQIEQSLGQPDRLAELLTVWAEKLALPEAGAVAGTTRELAPIEMVFIGCGLGILDAHAASRPADTEAKLTPALEVLRSRFEAALTWRVEIGAPSLSLFVSDVQSRIADPKLFTTIMRHIALNELRQACVASFVREATPAGRRSSNSAFLGDADPMFHFGWPTRLAEWLERSDPAWALVAQAVERGRPVQHSEASDVLSDANSRAWTLHTTGCADWTDARAMQSALPTATMGIRSYPILGTSLAGPLDTLAWILSDLGEHDGALNAQRIAVLLSGGNPSLTWAYREMAARRPSAGR